MVKRDFSIFHKHVEGGSLIQEMKVLGMKNELRTRKDFSISDISLFMRIHCNVRQHEKLMSSIIIIMPRTLSLKFHPLCVSFNFLIFLQYQSLLLLLRAENSEKRLLIIIESEGLERGITKRRFVWRWWMAKNENESKCLPKCRRPLRGDVKLEPARNINAQGGIFSINSKVSPLTLSLCVLIKIVSAEFPPTSALLLSFINFHAYTHRL